MTLTDYLYSLRAFIMVQMSRIIHFLSPNTLVDNYYIAQLCSCPEEKYVFALFVWDLRRDNIIYIATSKRKVLCPVYMTIFDPKVSGLLAYWIIFLSLKRV